MTGPGPVGGDAGGTHADRHRPPADNPPAEHPPPVDSLEHSTGGSATLPLRGPRSGAPGLEPGPRTVHLIGVGGAGMSGLARLLLAAGHRVTGSDRSESATLEALRALGARVWPGHDGTRMGRPDLVAASTAIRATNPELVAARLLDIPVLGRAQLLALLMAGRTGIAVAGTHGKTTTTGMVVAILEAAGLDPSFAVGGDFKASGVNAAAGAGPHFVAEADESDGSFLELAPTMAVVTNVEADHLDHWGDLASVQRAFRSFVGRLPADGTAVLCADDPGALDLAAAAACQVVTYGFATTADVRGDDLTLDAWSSVFTVTAGERSLGQVRLIVPGRHNVQNALGAIAAALAVRAPFEAAVAGLARFTGAARRFHLRAEVGGVTVVDDYAHNPPKVAAALAAARLGPWKRVVAVFQPHLYSRTRLFADDFGLALAGGADLAVVTDVYAAREDPEPGVDGALVAGAAKRARPDLDCVYEPDRTALATRVAALVQPGDLVLTLGAGDITDLADELGPLLGAAGRGAAGGGAAGDGGAGEGVVGEEGSGGGGGRGGGGGAVDDPRHPRSGSATLPHRGTGLPAEGGDP
jgi:UDP-N-acetylmuramate--alanine ligase